MLDDATLAELERLDREATPGPWREYAESGDWWIEGDAAYRIDAGPYVTDASDLSVADMLLIIAARNHLPALVAAVRELRAERDALRTLVEHMTVCVQAFVSACRRCGGRGSWDGWGSALGTQVPCDVCGPARTLLAVVSAGRE